MKTERLYTWHVHHNQLAELLTGPIAARIAYIKMTKPAREIATRLRLLKVIKDQEAVATAWKAYKKAIATEREAYNKAAVAAWKAYNKADATAWKAYNKAAVAAWKAYNKTLASIHAKECPDCPWDGKTIFPEKE